MRCREHGNYIPRDLNPPSTPLSEPQISQHSVAVQLKSKYKRQSQTAESCISTVIYHQRNAHCQGSDSRYTGHRKSIKMQSRANILSQDSAVGIVTRLQAGRSGARNLRRDMRLCSSPKRPYWLSRSTQHPVQWAREVRSSPGSKADGAWG
jgi:hypothetical protein